MGKTQDNYQLATLHMLAEFQLIEQSLKLYISTAYRLASICIDGAMHFGYSEKDLDSLSLERLLLIFAKFNENSELISALNKLKSQRNHIAHKSLTIAMGRYADIKALRAGLASYVELAPKLHSCLDLISEEHRVIVNKLSSLEQARSDRLFKELRDLEVREMHATRTRGARAP